MTALNTVHKKVIIFQLLALLSHDKVPAQGCYLVRARQNLYFALTVKYWWAMKQQPTVVFLTNLWDAWFQGVQTPVYYLLLIPAGLGLVSSSSFANNVSQILHHIPLPGWVHLFPRAALELELLQASPGSTCKSLAACCKHSALYYQNHCKCAQGHIYKWRNC